MNSKITLALIINILIINESFAKDAALDACDAAIKSRQYTQAITIAEQHADQAGFWLCKGRAQSALNQNAAAQESFKQAIAHRAEGLDLVSAYMLLGNAQLEEKAHDVAIASYQQALKLSEEHKMRRYTRIAHNLIGEAYFDIGQYAEALKAFETAEKLAMNDDERADSYIHEALAYQQLQQIDQAITYQLKGTMMLRKSGTPDQYAEASLTLGKLFASKQDFVGASKTYQRLMEYAQENGGIFYEAKTAIYWAETKRAQGDLEGAEQLIKQARRIAAQYKDAELEELLAKFK